MAGMEAPHGMNDGTDQPPASSMTSFLLAEYRDISEEFQSPELAPMVAFPPETPTGILKSPNHCRRMPNNVSMPTPCPTA